MTRAKICGITRLEDAELAVDLGAWALGFILWPGSPRACAPGVAAQIARRYRRRVCTVGVLVNPTLEEVARASAAARARPGTGRSRPAGAPKSPRSSLAD